MLHDVWIMKVNSEIGGTETLTAASAALWGNQDRLIVAWAISEADPADLYGQALGERLGISDSRVGLQLRKFTELGLLVRLPKAGGARRVYYQRANQAFWDAVREMCEALRA
jgi:DNA-binding transcriptional regulator GbsR (MarR family)